MRLAIVRQRYNPFGGAERFVERATAALRGQGAAVTIISRQWLGADGSGSWLRCDPFYIGRLWRDWSFARAVCAAVRPGTFELVQSHERIACCDIYRAGDGVHAQWLEYRSQGRSPWSRRALALNPYHRYLLRAEKQLFASPRLRGVICNSRMVRAEITRWFAVDEAKLHVIYNGVDLDCFHPRLKSEHRSAFRAKLGIAAGAPVILFVGSGFERKGLGMLIDAFARLPRPDARLIVVGKDASQAKHEARARSLGLTGRIHWAGGQQDVRPWYGTADVFALPTRYDPFPNAAMEAMASGLALVTTRHCGTAELIEEGKNGFVCRDPFDANELSARLAEATAGAASLGSHARRTAEAYGIADMAEALLALYRKLLGPGLATV